MEKESTTIAFGGWQLCPERGAIHPGERTAVVADVHLGYEWARGEAGDSVLAHSYDETRDRLTRLLSRADSPITRLVVAGDLVESPRRCRRTAADVDRLRRWLGDRGVELIALQGNHDPPPRPVSGAGRSSADGPRPALTGLATIEVGGWTIGHGHRPIPGERTISGHLHPILRWGRIAAPSFLVGPDRIILPAFSANAAGWDVSTSPASSDFDLASLRCLVTMDSGLLDFGLIRSFASARRNIRI
jgi:metallophosphoesterase superfamily enzyme